MSLRAIALLMLMPCVAASGATLRVPADHADIQEALDAAEDGDTVLVARGEYLIGRALDGNRLHDPAVPGGPPLKNYTLKAEAGPGETIIRFTALGDSSVIEFRRGETASTILEGFTITGGTGSHVFFEGTGGGGILCSGSSPTIRNCRITRNIASTGGGGLLALRGAKPEVLDCEIDENEAALGGGIAVMHSDEVSAIKLRRSVLRKNSSLMGGGLYGADGATLDMESCDFAENEALVLGGGLCFLDTDATIAKCTVLDNRGEDGGGIYAGAGRSRIVNCLVAGNAAYNGGGVFIDTAPGLEFPDSSAQFLHCTIAGNSAIESQSGGLYLFQGEAEIQNCILWGNLGGSFFEDNGEGRFDFSIMEDTKVPQGEGNSNRDPLFLAEGEWDDGGTDDDPFDDAWTPGDYMLGSGSPAIDTGSAAGAPPDDLEGNARPCGAGVDMGAYESGGCAGAQFRRGDANLDAVLDLTDPIFTLDALFRGRPQPGCADAADADDDGLLRLTDAVYTLNHLFLSGPAPATPGPDSCGIDPTSDEIQCTGSGC